MLEKKFLLFFSILVILRKFYLHRPSLLVILAGFIPKIEIPSNVIILCHFFGNISKILEIPTEPSITDYFSVSIKK